MLNVEYLSMAELEAGMDHIRQAPSEHGTLKMIVRRPQEDERDVTDHGELSPIEGLVGDNWKSRGSSHTPDGSATRALPTTAMTLRSPSSGQADCEVARSRCRRFHASRNSHTRFADGHTRRRIAPRSDRDSHARFAR